MEALHTSSKTLGQSVKEEKLRGIRNEQIVKETARKFLGHVYDIRRNELEYNGVEHDFPDEWIRLDSSTTKYVAMLHHAQESAIEALDNHFSLSITANPIPVHFRASADHKKSESAESNSMFCAVACLKVDRCSFRRFPNRIAPTSDSLDKKIVKSVTLYVGYRIILEFFSHQEKTEKAKGASLGIEASTLPGFLGGGIDLKYESKAFSGKQITHVNIREFIGFGSYKVPPIEVNPHDFRDLQTKLERIRQDFLSNCSFLAGREKSINPKKDLEPLREISPSQLKFLETPRAAAEQEPAPLLFLPERDEAYFATLAKEINEALNADDQTSLKSETCSFYGRELSLDHMLYFMDKAFTNLYKYMPEPSGSYTLILGDAGIGKSIVGASLMGAALIEQHRFLPYEDPRRVLVCLKPEGNPSLDFPEIRHDGRIPNGVQVYGRFIETPILGDLRGEYGVCYGAATSFAISRYQPKEILVVLNPRELINDTATPDRPGKATEIVRGLRRAVYDPFLAKNKIRFVMNYPQQGPCAHNANIIAQIDQKLKALGRPSPVWSRMRSFFLPEEARWRLAIKEEEIKALELIRERMACTADLETALPADPVPELQPVNPLFDLPKGFDIDNINLNRFSQFKSALEVTLSHFSYLQKRITSLKGEVTTYEKLLISVDKIKLLLKSGELQKIDQAEAGKLNITIEKEVQKSSEELQKKQETCANNVKTIESLTAEINTLKKDPTPTELKLTPHITIRAREWWHFLGTEYKFNGPKCEILDCDLTQGKGKFSCDKKTFLETKQVQFTPKWCNEPEDLLVHVPIWVAKKDHPDTPEEIRKKEASKKEYEATNAGLATEIESIESTIKDLKAREIPRLEQKSIELQKEKETRKKELARLQSQLTRYQPFYDTLKFIQSHISNSKKE